MIRFAREYDVSVILQQPVAKLAESAESSAIIPQSSCPRIVQDLLAQIPWGHNILLMEKFEDLPTHLWYAQQTIVNGWSRDTLTSTIEIGLILCQTTDRVLAEYTLRDIHKPIGVADDEFTHALPQELASILPSIKEIETELQHELRGNADRS
jgi:hypothetical protein